MDDTSTRIDRLEATVSDIRSRVAAIEAELGVCLARKIDLAVMEVRITKWSGVTLFAAAALAFCAGYLTH